MKKRNKILIILGSVLIVLFFIARQYANSFVQDFIRKEINALIEEQKDNYYIEVGDINVKILAYRFILEDVLIHSLDSIPNADQKQSFFVNLDRISVKLHTYTDVLSSGILNVKSIKLDNPRIDIIQNMNEDSTRFKEKSKFTSAKLKRINLGLLEINGGDFYFHQSQNSRVKLINSVINSDLLMNSISFELDQKELKDKITFNKIKIDIESAAFHDSQKHDFSLQNLRYSNEEKGIKIEEIHIRNKESLDEFKDADYKDGFWGDFKLNELLLQVDLHALLKKEIIIKALDLKDLDVELFSIKKKAESESLSYKNIISKLNLPVTLDSFNIQRGNIDLSFHNKRTNTLDEYQFNNMSINLMHFSNDSLYLIEHPTLKGSIISKVWRTGSLDASFSWNPKSSLNTANIHVKNIPERKLKEFINDENYADFRSGKIEYIDLNLSSDSNHFEGKLRVSIKKLNVAYDNFKEGGKIKSIDAQIKELTLVSDFYKEENEALEILIDSLQIQSPKIKLIENEFLTDIESPSVKKENVRINLNFFSLKNAVINYQKEGEETPIIEANNISIINRGLILDLSRKGSDQIVNLGYYSINTNDIRYFKAPNDYYSLSKLNIKKTNHEIDIIGFRYKNKTSKNVFHKSASQGNVWMSAYIEKISISSDLSGLLKKDLHINNITAIRPILTYIQAIEREEAIEKRKKKKEKIQDSKFAISLDRLALIDADIDFRIKKKDIREFEVFDLSNLNGSLRNLQINSNDNYADKLLRGSFTAEFYDHSKIEIEIEHEQGKTHPKTKIEGKMTAISLSSVKKRTSIFSNLSYKDGNVESIDFSINLSDGNIDGDVNINSIDIEQLNLGKSKNPDWLTLKLDKISISFSKLKNEKLQISNFKFVQPIVDIHHIDESQSKSTDKKKKNTLFAEHNIFNPLAIIDNIEIIKGTVNQYNDVGKRLPLTSMRNINLNAKKIIVYDSTDTTLPLSINDLDIKMDNIELYSIPDHDFSIASFELNLVKKKILIKDLEFKNKNTPEVYFSQLDFRKGWLDLVVPEIEIDFDINEFFSDHPRISKISTNGIDFTTHVNFALELPKEEKPLPGKILKSIKFPITIDSILIDNAELDVKFRDSGGKYGLLDFNDIKAHITNLTTDKELVEENNTMKLVMDAVVWKSGIVKADVTIYLDSDNDAFELIATVDSLNLADSDTLTSGLYGIAVNSGFLYHSYYDINGNNDDAKGVVSFEYDDLHLSVEKKKKEPKNGENLSKTKDKDKLNQSFVKKAIINGFIRNKNTQLKGNYIPYGDVYFVREKNKPIFALMWYSISVGLLEIMEAGIIRDGRNLIKGFKKKDKNE